MKLIGLFILLFSLNSSAGNPLIRSCHITEGVFHSVKMEDDEVGFCIYGSSMIDALSVLDATTARYNSTATNAALGSGSDCATAGGESIQAEDLEGLKFNLCLFEDGSAIESKTLARGSAHADNAGLVRTLQTRF